MSEEQIARYKPGENLTVKANEEGVIHAGRFVVYTGVDAATGVYEGEEAAAELKGNKPVFGVSQRETTDPESEPANSVDLLTEVTRSGSVARVKCAAEVKAGEEVETAAEGQATPWETEGKKGVAIGLALTTAKKDAYVEVDLY